MALHRVGSEGLKKDLEMFMLRIYFYKGVIYYIEDEKCSSHFLLLR